MKRKNSFFSLILAFSLLLLCLCSCSGGGGESSAPQESSSEPLPPPTVYTIIYNARHAETANRVAEAVKTASGLEFECVKYKENMVLPENAVIVGNISDEMSNTLKDGLAPKDYGIRLDSGHIYCYGGTKDAVEGAADYLIENLIGNRGIELEDSYDYFYDHPYSLENAFVNGIKLEYFNLIYAATNNEAKYSDVAEAFKTYLAENGNINVSTSATDIDDAPNEILIGIVPGREIVSGENESQYDYNEYKITVSGNKIAVVGNNACAVWHGLVALADAISAAEGRNLTDTVIEGTCKLVKVSCVGDSITEGVNSTDIYSQTYPVYIQKMLGFDYLVKNHGHSGYSTVFTDEYSYSKSYRFTQAKEFAPDVVIYMLGTNDCNPGQEYKSWEDGTREVKYREDTLKYFNAFREINENVQIFMCIPPTLCYSTVWPWEAWAAGIEAHTAIINREIAEQEGLHIVDMFTWSKEHPEVFPDGLHPYNESYKTYAKRVYDEIIDTIITVDDLK